jgi:hypothetical protein
LQVKFKLKINKIIEYFILPDLSSGMWCLSSKGSEVEVILRNTDVGVRPIRG